VPGFLTSDKRLLPIASRHAAHLPRPPLRVCEPAAITLAPAPMVVTALLPAVLDDDPDERAVTDTLLDRVDLSAELEHLIDGLAELLTHATAAATRRAYESDFSHFSGWATAHGLSPLPASPHTVALYVTAHQDLLRPASLLRRLSAIAVAHRGGGYPSPSGHELVRRAVAGLRRKHGTRPAAKAALVTAQLAVICTRLHAQTITPATQETPGGRAGGCSEPVSESHCFTRAARPRPAADRVRRGATAKRTGGSGRR
jgi:hypothetical protein